MLYVFVGNDVVSVRRDAHVFLDARGGEVVRVTAESYLPGILQNYLVSQSLFEVAEEPVVLDFLSEHEDALDSVDKEVAALAASPRIFVVLDEKPRAAREKLFRAHAHTYAESADMATKEGFNTFLLADALSRKDKKSLWVLLMRARLAGSSSEEIVGILFWQLKALILAATTSSAEEAGMKDYPYKKAKGALKTFAKGELEMLAESLLKVYHRGHAEGDMDVDLERFVLGM